MGTMPLDPLYKIGVLDGKKHERTRVLAVIASERERWGKRYRGIASLPVITQTAKNIGMLYREVDGAISALDELREKLEGNDGHKNKTG